MTEEGEEGDLGVAAAVMVVEVGDVEEEEGEEEEEEEAFLVFLGAKENFSVFPVVKRIILLKTDGLIVNANVVGTLEGLIR